MRQPTEIQSPFVKATDIFFVIRTHSPHHFNHFSACTFINALRISKSSTVVILIFFSDPGTMCISRHPSSAMSVQDAIEFVIPFSLASSWARMRLPKRNV